MTLEPRDYIEHVDECIRNIRGWAAEGRDVFMTDIRTRAAMIRKLQELSESVRRLYPSFHEKYPEFPWRDVIGFRNVLVHDYLGLNLDRIWEIVTESLPQLEPSVARMLAEVTTPS